MCYGELFHSLCVFLCCILCTCWDGCVFLIYFTLFLIFRFDLFLCESFRKVEEECSLQTIVSIFIWLC